MRLLVKRGNSEIQIYIYITAASYIRNRYVAMVAVYIESITPWIDSVSSNVTRLRIVYEVSPIATRMRQNSRSIDLSFLLEGKWTSIYIYGSYNKDELEKRLLLRCETRQLWKTVLRLASRGISIRSILGFRYISSFLVRRIEFVPFTA